jgi:hypothetical protein
MVFTVPFLLFSKVNFSTHLIHVLFSRSLWLGIALANRAQQAERD